MYFCDFSGGGGGGSPDPQSPPSGSAHVYGLNIDQQNLICVLCAIKVSWVEFKQNSKHFASFSLQCVTKILFFLTKTYVVGAQKNRLNETVLLSTPNVY